MADLIKAQRLATLFIRHYRKYRHNQDKALFKQLQKINADYKVANGGGDLFKTVGEFQSATNLDVKAESAKSESLV